MGHFVVCNVRLCAFVSVASNKVLVMTVVLLENIVRQLISTAKLLTSAESKSIAPVMSKSVELS